LEAYSHGMAQTITLTALYEPAEDDWVQARVAEIPAVITCAPTRSEAKEMLIDALREFFLSFTEEPAASTSADRLPVEVQLRAG